MKKLLLMAILFASVGFASAQAKPVQKKEVKTAKDSKMAAKDAKADSKMAVKSATGTKKDGSLDMRLKVNKDAKAAAAKAKGPLKKDGTPDKRYKDNKK